MGRASTHPGMRSLKLEQYLVLKWWHFRSTQKHKYRQVCILGNGLGLPLHPLPFSLILFFLHIPSFRLESNETVSFFKTPVALMSIFTCLAEEGLSEVCPVELDVVVAAVMSVVGSGAFSMSFTFLWRLARCLLSFEVEFFAVNKIFAPTANIFVTFYRVKVMSVLPSIKRCMVLLSPALHVISCWSTHRLTSHRSYVIVTRHSLTHLLLTRYCPSLSTAPGLFPSEGSYWRASEEGLLAVLHSPSEALDTLHLGLQPSLTEVWSLSSAPTSSIVRDRVSCQCCSGGMAAEVILVSGAQMRAGV